MPAHLRRDAAAGIADLHHRIPALHPQRKPHLAAGLGELDGVGKQVVPHQAQQLGVGVDQHALGNVGLDLQLLGLPGGLKAQQALAQLLAQVIGGGGRVDLLVFQLVQLQDVGDQVGQPAGGIGHGAGVLLPLFLRKPRLPQQRAVVLQHRQRGFQLVADVGDKIAAQRFHAGKFLRQLVEGLGDHVKAVLAPNAQRRDAHRKVPPGDLLGRAGDLPHRARHQKAAAHLVHHGAQHAQQHHIAKGQLGRPADLLPGELDAQRGLQLADKQQHTAADDKRHGQKKGHIPPQRQQPALPAGSLRAHFSTAL